MALVMEPAGGELKDGQRVVLREPFYGYPSGARGVVQGTKGHDGRIRVRFDGTRIGLLVSREILEPSP